MVRKYGIAGWPSRSCYFGHVSSCLLLRSRNGAPRSEWTSRAGLTYRDGGRAPSARGTVTGLIQAFVQLSASNGYATLADVSGGIYQSLLTTAAGLVVAIPTILAYCYLSARLNALLHEMERAGIEAVNLLSEGETDSSIIEFAPKSQAAGEHR